MQKRPKKKPQKKPRVSRSVRFSEEEWQDIEKKAERFGLTASAAVRQAALSWARSPT